MVGHYSDFGTKIRNEILDESALDMFWFIDPTKKEHMVEGLHYFH